MQPVGKMQYEQAKRRRLSKSETNIVRVQTFTDERVAILGDPVLRFHEFLAVTKVGKSKAYDLMNPKSPGYDPDFPTGFPLFDSPRSPKGYWRHEAMAWLDGRSKKFRKQQKSI